MAVVPIPWSVGSALAAARILALAVSSARRSRSVKQRGEWFRSAAHAVVNTSWTVSTAIRLAVAPPAAPPIPSATIASSPLAPSAKRALSSPAPSAIVGPSRNPGSASVPRSSATRKQSWFSLRFRPASVLPKRARWMGRSSVSKKAVTCQLRQLSSMAR